MTDTPSGTPSGGAADRRGLARTVLLAALGAGALVFLMVLAASVRQTPGVGGVLTGIVTGLFAGLLVAGAGAWGAMRLVARPAAVPDTAIGGELVQTLAQVLGEIEAMRIDMVRQATARARWRIPLCVVGVLLLWLVGRLGDDPGDFVDLLQLLAFGALVGWGWAEFAIRDQYRRLYRDRVLPLLAARFGAINYRQSTLPDLGKLTAEHVFGDCDSVVSENEFVGTHRGLPIDIVDLTLTKGSGDDVRQIFTGLLVTVELPRALRGTTAVIADGDMFSEARDWMTGNSRARVRIEDPEFEKAYQVYGTDQIAARALLTPAFIERFRALAALSWAGQPLALVADNRLTLAIPRIGHSLFEPPSFREPAASRAALATLYNDIVEVFATVDTVIDLDQAARGVAASHDAVPGAIAGSAPSSNR